jgi:ABC-type uncharacterized transport system permease subunit
MVAAVALSAPLLFVALGELISEIAGVINIQLEGMMLMGAFTAMLGAFISHRIEVGFFAAALGGVMIAGLHGVICLVFRVNQVVSGVVLNLLALGVTTFGLEIIFGSNFNRSVPTLDKVAVPLFSDIPVVGQAFFNQPASVYVAFLAVPLIWWVLNKTVIGLVLRATGERPEAADALGLRVLRVRWIALLVCGALAGLGGAQLILAGLGFFTQNVTAGRGFIALAAVIFGRWTPFGTAAAVLFFATADAFQIRAQALGIHAPYQLLVALPYLVTLIALAGLLRGMRAPAALATNYEPR